MSSSLESYDDLLALAESVRRQRREADAAAAREREAGREAERREIEGRLQAERDARIQILENFQVQKMLEILAEKWDGQEVTPFIERLDSNRGTIEGWQLKTKGYRVPVLSGQGKDLALKLNDGQGVLKVGATDEIDEDRRIIIYDQGVYDLRNAQEKRLGVLVRESGLEAGLKKGIGNRRLGDNQFLQTLSASKHGIGNLAELLEIRTSDRNWRNSMPPRIREWTAWVQDQFTGRDLGVGLKPWNLREWGHEQIGSRALTRWIDARTPFKLGL